MVSNDELEYDNSSFDSKKDMVWWFVVDGHGNRYPKIKIKDDIIGTLAQHKIDGNGVVQPSVLIKDHTGELYHGFIKLKDYQMNRGQGEKEDE